MKKQKILLINTCKERLHYLEFVKPLEDILRKEKLDFYTKHYSKFEDKDLKSDRIIICGTSLRDNFFLKDLEKFKWVNIYDRPILGICAGMQIISLLNKSNILYEKEIGFFKEDFVKEFLSLKGKNEVYHLHNNYTSPPQNFEDFTKSKIPQAIKHKSKPIYGVLFHPEVRNKELILNFCKI